MKNAYKGGGLRVRNNGEGINVSGSSWTAFWYHGDIPKETLGDLVALVGELPEKWECYTADKNGNQMEIWDDSIMSAMEIAIDGGAELKVTAVTVDSFPYSMRVIQGSNNEITLIDDRLQAMIQPSLIDVKDDEELPTGPILKVGSILGTPVRLVCWKNDRMAFCAMPMIPSDENIVEMIKKFEEITLWRMKDET